MLPEFFGRYCVQLGSWGLNGQMLNAAATLHRLVLGTVRDTGNHVLIAPDRLPLPDKCVDTLLLPHALEFAQSPHHTLREVSRVLTDRGAVVVLGFNPWSFWGMRQRLAVQYRAFPDGARFLSAGRICDWLELLDFEVTELRRFGPGLPWRAPSSRGWLGPLADQYMIVARKRVLPMTLIGRPLRAKVASILGGGIAVPEARNTPHDA